MDKPLTVAVGMVIDNEKILLLKREKEPYRGLWSLPGGKVKKDEHVSQAAIRELMEESGLNCEIEEYLGYISEHLIESSIIKEHFLIHAYKLSSAGTSTKEGVEGELKWFNLNEIGSQKDLIIPSDYLMIEKLLINPGKNHYDCKIIKENDKYNLEVFE